MGKHNNQQSKKQKAEEHQKRQRDESLNTTDDYKNRIAVLEGELFDLHASHCNVLKEVELLRQQNSEFKETLSREIHRNDILHNTQQQLEQYTRRNNIRIFGVRDTNPKETAVETEHLVAQLCQQKLGYPLQSWEVEVAHRTGKFLPDGNRPIIVRLVSRKTRASIMAKRRQLKGTKIVIAEDLTRETLQLYRRVRDLDCVGQAWTRDGRIFAKSKNNPPLIKEIDLKASIDETLFDTSSASAAGSAKVPVTKPMVSSAAASVTSSVSTATSSKASSGSTTKTSSTTSSVTSPATSSARGVASAAVTKTATNQTRGREDDMDTPNVSQITNSSEYLTHTSTPANNKDFRQTKLNFN